MFSKEALNFLRDLLKLNSRAKAKAFLIFVIYFILINIVTYIVMTIDKKLARKDKKRIPENGGLGAILSMKRHAHKTQKKSFTIGMPITAALNVIALAFEILVVYIY